MEPIKVLIVDDDVISRKMLRTILEKEDDMTVVGLSPDGERCINNIPLQKPDLVTLDIEMPGIGGLETLKRIRESWPDLPVIMYSASTKEGAAATLRALDLGASDYVTKPAGRSVEEFPLEAVRKKLVPMIRGLVRGVHATKTRLDELRARAKRNARAQSAKAPIDVVAIGLSTGGPNALAKLVPQLDGKLPVPLVLVQHMPETFTALLAERLNELSDLTVVEGVDGMELRAGTLYIAPGNYHMTIAAHGSGARIRLNQAEKVHSCRPAVDVLFESVKQVYGANTLAVVMTGMGTDGRDGANALQERGAQVFIQDEATSVVWGMPGSIAEAGIPHEVYPLEGIAAAINSRVFGLGQSSTRRSKSA